jgi:TetR/AcrR family transcriptional regulator, cholesterol catabolism regulator
MADEPEAATKRKSVIGRRRLVAKWESRNHYSERREALRRAAAQLFKEQGFKQTSLDDVARLAGVDRSSLYYYISSKKDLFLEVVGEAMEIVGQKIRAIDESDLDTVSKVEQLCITLMDNYASNYPYLYVYLQEDLTQDAKTPQLRSLVELGRQIGDVVVRIIRDGVREGQFRSDISPKVAAYGILGMTNWTHRWFNPAGPLSGEEIGRQFARMILSGMLAPAGDAGRSSA